jgi:phosphatidylglycerol:prolipoprotein diacylglycerol transferase
MMNTMENYMHGISPIAVQLYGDIAIRWYGLAYLAGLLLGLLLMRLMSKRGGNLLNFEELSDLVTWSALGVMIGGRLGYCLFYSPDLLIDFSSSFPFWGALKVWEGGMASHGGFIGVLTSSYLFSRKYNYPFLHINDLTVLGGSLGFFFGRLANFINGELYGRVVTKPTSWAVKFPQEMSEWLSPNQAKLMELKPLAEKFNSASGLNLESQGREWSTLVQEFSINSQSQNMVRSFVNWLQNKSVERNQEVLEALSTVLSPRYPSQLIQALLEGLCVFIILNLIWLKPRKPGVITAWFGILYAIARIIGEQFRMPDTQLGFQALGLTRGQWLSVAMLIGGILLLIATTRSSSEKIKGWSKG